MAKFLHSADWQIGMTRHFLAGEAQSRYSAARLDAIRTTGQVAAESGCAFAVVAGDVFDSNYLDRKDVARALDAMSAFTVPLYLMPGNHDVAGPGSVYRSKDFISRKSETVHVLEDAGVVVVPGTDVELVAAPLQSKRPLEDLVAAALAPLPAPDAGMHRVVVGHGAVDRGAPDQDNPALISIAALEQAAAAGTVHYVALGDRHSTTNVGSSGRIWYSGTQEVTDYVETDPGNVLVVELDEARISVTPHHVGKWKFLARHFPIESPDDIETCSRWLDSVDGKATTSVKLSFTGTLSLASKAHLDQMLTAAADLFAAVETWESHTDLAVMPDDADIDALGLSGFAAAAAADLDRAARAGGPDAVAAQDALGLLYRLTRSVA